MHVDVFPKEILDDREPSLIVGLQWYCNNNAPPNSYPARKCYFSYPNYSCS